MNHAETLLKHFPDAVLITEGLDKGKYETTDWLFHLECGFYIRKSDRRLEFVNRLNDSYAWEHAFHVISGDFIPGYTIEYDFTPLNAQATNTLDKGTLTFKCEYKHPDS